MKSKKTRARDQIEAEKERKESLLLHHENADFFYALDKKVQKVRFEITLFYLSSISVCSGLGSSHGRLRSRSCLGFKVAKANAHRIDFRLFELEVSNCIENLRWRPFVQFPSPSKRRDCYLSRDWQAWQLINPGSDFFKANSSKKCLSKVITFEIDSCLRNPSKDQSTLLEVSFNLRRNLNQLGHTLCCWYGQG